MCNAVGARSDGIVPFFTADFLQGDFSKRLWFFLDEIDGQVTDYFGSSDVDSAAAVTILLAISKPLTIFSIFFKSLAEAVPVLAVLLLTVLEAALPLPTDDGDGDR